MPCTEGCGSCCDPVTLTEGFIHMLFERIGPLDQQGQWLTEHWEPLRTNADGVTVLRCINYDVETRRCLAYASRPPVCSMFPFYGEDPASTERMVKNVCGYQAELGRTVLPIVAVT